LGAVDEVLGAMTRVVLPEGRLLVDCGAPTFRGPWTLPPDAKDVDAVLLTHGHVDHVSGLPQLLDTGFDKPIIGTRATLEITRIALRDSVRLRGGSNKDIQRFLKHFDSLTQPATYGRTRRWVKGVDVDITFHEAGHIIGSASIELSTPTCRVLLSGDLGRPNSPLLRDYNTQYAAGRPFDMVLLEATYGGREHKRTFADIAQDLLRIIQRARRDSGHILVPAFAVGRTQTLLYLINELVESGKIRDLPVAIDSPMALKITELHQRFSKLFDREALALIDEGDDPLEFDDLYAVYRGRDSRKLRDAEEMLVIAGSGMCTGGRILGHLKELLPVPETCVLFVGYQAHGTLGRKIQRAAREKHGRVYIDDEAISVRADVEVLTGLSAHADRSELADWLRAVPSPQRVGLHHGDRDAQHAFTRWFNPR